MEQTPTDEQIEEMRAIVAEADRKKAEAAAAAEAEYLRPLREFTNCPQFQALQEAIPTIEQTYGEDERFATFITNLVLGLRLLPERAGPLSVDAPAAEGEKHGE